MISIKTGTKTLLILEMLRSKGPMYGLELVKQSDGALKRGSVYVTLARLEDRGWVSSKRLEQPDGQKSIKRQYNITGEGRRVALAAEAMASAYEEGESLVPS